MDAPHHVIYIPGLADTGINRKGQEFALALWRLRFGITTELIQVGWAEASDSFEAKMERLLAHIDAAKATGRTVSLVASSAGASLATNAFAARTETLHRVVVIVGALGPVKDAKPEVLVHNPSFKVSLERQPAAIALLSAADRTRILSVKPQKDRIVPLYDMNIEGINYMELSTKNHLQSIAAALTTQSSKIIAFIKCAPEN